MLEGCHSRCAQENWRSPSMHPLVLRSSWRFRDLSTTAGHYCIFTTDLDSPMPTPLEDARAIDTNCGGTSVLRE